MSNPDEQSARREVLVLLRRLFETRVEGWSGRLRDRLIALRVKSLTITLGDAADEPMHIEMTLRDVNVEGS